MACSRCGRSSGGKYGHTARTCYYQSTTAGARLAPRCKTCQKEGHTAKDCNGRAANSSFGKFGSRAGAAAAARAAPVASGGGSSHCSRCGYSSSAKYGHTNMPGDECYARTTAAGASLAPRCKMCQQEGHTAKDCNGRVAHSKKRRASASTAGEPFNPKKAKFAAARAAAMAKLQQRARAKAAQTRVVVDPLQARRVTAASRASSSARANPPRVVDAATGRGVYVIECNDEGFYYVGKSENIARRIEQHRDGNGSAAWVKMHGGVKRVHKPMDPENSNLNAWEQAETTNRMLLHGFDKVRGWEFTTTRHLPAEKLETVKTLIFGKHDACRKCGHEGHMAARCPGKGKNVWLAKIDRRIKELKARSAALVSQQRAPSVARGPSLAALQSQSQQAECDDDDGDDYASGRGGRSCTCGTDISDRPPSHSQCMPCYRSRSSSSRSQYSEDDGRSCDTCGQDISDRPPSHSQCLPCYRSRSSRRQQSQYYATSSYDGRRLRRSYDDSSQSQSSSEDDGRSCDDWSDY